MAILRGGGIIFSRTRVFFGGGGGKVIFSE